jgi:hypothetical protein
MTAWTSEELTRIGTAEQLEIAALRRDGTLSSSRTIWVVPYGDGLYVRSVNGPDAGWYRGTRVRRQGHIRAGGLGKDVTFLGADPELNDAIDALYATSTAATAPARWTASPAPRHDPPPSNSSGGDPTAVRPGDRWADHHGVTNGMPWKLRTGAPPRDLPNNFRAAVIIATSCCGSMSHGHVWARPPRGAHPPEPRPEVPA